MYVSFWLQSSFSLYFSGGTDLENPFSFTFTKGGNISEKTCYTNMKNLSEKSILL